MDKLTTANSYVQRNKHKVNSRPLYHFTPEIGWMNDPNGFIYYKGEYQLYYQCNPYGVVWDDMHWGHATTNDFITWEYKPIAMANDKLFDANGCFSGSAIEKDGKLFVMYTGHIDPNLGFDRDEAQIIEQQCLAYSSDGINFEKYEHNPVISEKDLPEGYKIYDFRDPKVFQIGDLYYCVLAVRNADRRGEIVLYKSSDLYKWSFYTSIYQSKLNDNVMTECPDMFRIDGKDVLIFSIMPCDPMYDGKVQKKTVYVIGQMDFEKGVFQQESQGYLDYSANFYAPQSTEGKDGERVLIGWIPVWYQDEVCKEYGFNGMMSIPRKLSIREGKLLQQPVEDINQNFQHQETYKDVLLNSTDVLQIKSTQAAYLSLNFRSNDETKFQVELNRKEGKASRVIIDGGENTISLDSDYDNCEKITISDCDIVRDKVKLEFYIDRHSVEIFVNSGEKTMTYVSYARDKGTDIQIRGLNKTQIYEITHALLGTRRTL
ncbi:glycoside hydrolase family 32 protein [Bacillus sp. HMF5848]|uniref:glycoside hydrolase family 32 protein n=1 Tax=Bacillus sp. HMF5848 TaxID=2495421 RepID=UPI000F79BD7D|nr:glycoside hydrolase family 32 protein [Bacillus sp. HMF5848]RSK25935.1 glycoside hydrolase family 32 protein [Bacillus sp. HMF5848]